MPRMLSQLKHAFSHFSLFLDNPFYTIRSSTYLAYFREIRHIAETEPRPLDNPKYRTFLFSRLAFYLAICFYMFRGFIIVRLQVQGASLTDHASFDPLLSTIVLKNPALNYLTMSVLTLLGFFLIFLDYSLSFSLDFYLVNMFNNAVSNGTNFFTLNPRLRVPQELSLTKPKAAYLQLRAWYGRMRNPTPSPTFAHSNPPVTHVSPRLRTRLVLQCALYEGAFGCLNLTIVFHLLLLALTLLSIVYPEVSLPLFLLSLFDALLFSLLLLHTITNLSFGLHGLFVPRFLTRAHLSELNRSLASTLIQLRYLQNNVTYNHQLLLQRQLRLFYREHHFLQYFQQYFNRKVISRLSLGTFLTNIFLQIILLNLLLRSELKTIEIISIFIFLSGQAILLIIACQVIIVWTNSLFSPAPLLFQAQFLLRRRSAHAPSFAYPRHLSAKLHLMTYFELLATRERELFTLGAFADISTTPLVKFFFGYTGFFMYVSMLMQELHLY